MKSTMLAFVSLLSAGSAVLAGTESRVSFDEPNSLGGWVVQATGEAGKRMPKPKIADGKLYLLESWWKSTAAAAGPAPCEKPTDTVRISWTLIMNTGTEGMGLAWLDVAKYGAKPAVPEALTEEDVPYPGGNGKVVEYNWGWEAPNLLRAFGVGLDASDPPNRDPFRGSGNVYDRPQHEISLHWDGKEIVKRMTATDFRDEKPHKVDLEIRFVTGGAEVSLSLDGTAVYESYFISDMTAFAGRPVFGARNTDTAGDVMIDDLATTCGETVPPAKPPVRVEILDHVLNDAKHGKNEAVVELPMDTTRYGRIICTLRLDKPETRFDPWDRTAHVWIEEVDAGTDAPRYELLRYITPYHRGFEWKVDVTDFRPLLTGPRKIIQDCGTQGEGWVVSITLDYYQGPPSDGVVAEKVVNLWSGAPEIGNPEKPVAEFYEPRTVEVDKGVTAAKVRMVVTGHGMAPNSQNAAEFMPIGRTLTVNGKGHRNRLWKEDNYLNPCRPQGGTWKYDRAGWAPGDVVRPWEVLVNDVADGKLRIEYALDPYVNENRGDTWAPSHVTEAQVILYRFVKRPD